MRRKMKHLPILESPALSRANTLCSISRTNYFIASKRLFCERAKGSQIHQLHSVKNGPWVRDPRLPAQRAGMLSAFQPNTRNMLLQLSTLPSLLHTVGATQGPASGPWPYSLYSVKAFGEWQPTVSHLYTPYVLLAPLQLAHHRK